MHNNQWQCFHLVLQYTTLSEVLQITTLSEPSREHFRQLLEGISYIPLVFVLEFLQVPHPLKMPVGSPG